MASPYLTITRQRFLHALEGLSDAQWIFKPDANTWSIAECSEHIVAVEQLVVQRIEGLMAQPEKPAQKSDWEGRDDVLVASIERREGKFQAPEMLHPQGRWATREETIRAFDEARRDTLELLARHADLLRSRIGTHPAVGKVDAYQLLLSIGAHAERHVRQIEELKAHPQFPPE